MGESVDQAGDYRLVHHGTVVFRPSELQVTVSVVAGRIPLLQVDGGARATLTQFMTAQSYVCSLLMMMVRLVRYECQLS